MSKTYTIDTKIKVTAEQVEDLVATAFDGGVTTQWCDLVQEGTPPKEATSNYSQDITRGGTIKLHVEDTGEWHELTLKSLLKAIGESNVDFEQYDAIDADEVIQKAIFGEVVYA